MKKWKNNIGLPPGTVQYTGQMTELDIRINYVEFNESHYKEELNQQHDKVRLHPSDLKLNQWYDIRGLHDEELIRKIGDTFSMHPIAIEDAVDVNQRPMFNDYYSGAFISFKSIFYDEEELHIHTQNVALYFGNGFVISFQENEDDLFEAIRDRLHNANARIRLKRTDYLAYALVDFIVDRYFIALEGIGRSIEVMEEEISYNPEEFEKSRILFLRKEIQKARKNISALREALLQFNRSELDFIEAKTLLFVRDVSDHVIQILDSIDNKREILAGLQDLYISEISLKMNQVMQFLTIITALFVPLSFLAGLYGMNFKYMPELGFKYGYFILLGVMLIIVIALIWNFKRKKWL